MNELQDTIERLQQQVQRLEAANRKRAFNRKLVIGALVLVSATASAQLVIFQPDSPALASEVNANFAQLKTWLEQKVGAAGSANVTLSGTTTLTGAVTITGGLPGSQIQDNSVASADVQDGTIANADFDLDLRCPDNSRQTLGQCLFYRPATGPAYIYNYRAAANACLAERARLCTRAELSAAQALGYERCSYGWLAERSDANATGIISFPMVQTLGGCGVPGLNDSTTAFTATYGAWCCK